MAAMNDMLVDGVLFVLASPILAAQSVRRLRSRYRFLRLAMDPEMTCESGRTLSLVGLWRCGCGFTYQGHLLRTCPVCDSLPSVIRCYRCGVTTKLPEAA